MIAIRSKPQRLNRHNSFPCFCGLAGKTGGGTDIMSVLLLPQSSWFRSQGLVGMCVRVWVYGVSAHIQGPGLLQLLSQATTTEGVCWKLGGRCTLPSYPLSCGRGSARWRTGLLIGGGANLRNGVLTLQRAIWVIILEQRQYSGTYTHAFFM